MSEKVKSNATGNYRHRLMRCCLPIAILVLSLPGWICIAMFIFARTGGEWAAAKVIDIPSDSELIARVVTDDWSYKHADYLYIRPATPLETREWFTSQGLVLTPYERSISGSGAYSTESLDDPHAYRTNGWITCAGVACELHHLSAILTAGWYEDMIRYCFSVRVYKERDLSSSDYFQDEIIPEGYTAFEVHTCWANAEYRTY
jgi:hypothetical protein